MMVHKKLLLTGVFALGLLSVLADEAQPTYIEGKPDYFASYVQGGNGRPRIDTGYVFKREPRVVLRMRLDEGSDADIAGMPAKEAGAFIICFDERTGLDDGIHVQYRYGQAADHGGWDLRYGTNTVAGIGRVKGKWITADFGREVFFDGRKIGEVQTFDFSNNTQTFSLFSGRNGAAINAIALAEAWLYDGGCLVRHLRAAVVKVEGTDTACFYDDVTDRCYINVGNTYKGADEGQLTAGGVRWREGVPLKNFVEYLSADNGNCCVDTGYAFTDRPRVRSAVKIMFTGDQNVCGATSKSGFVVNFDDSRTYVWTHLNDGNSATVNYGTSIVDQWVEGDFSDQAYLTIPGGETKRAATPVRDFSKNRMTFALFTGREQRPKVAFKTVEMYDGLDEGGNWKLVMYLKPAVDADDRPCYYDTLSGRCFYNSGTGTLTPGPAVSDLVPPATVLDWVGDGDVSGHDVDTLYAFTRQPLVKTSVYFPDKVDHDVAGTLNSAAGCFIVDLNTSANIYYYRYGKTGAESPAIDKVVGQWTDFIWGPKIVHDHGRMTHGSYSATFTGNTQTFHLFRARSSQGAFTGLRFRRTQMYDGFVLSDTAKTGRQTLVRDLVPAKDTDGVACFYDCVEGKYYYTSKSGSALAAGPLAAASTDVRTTQTRYRPKLTTSYAVVASRFVRLADVTGASAESEVARTDGVATSCFLENDPDHAGERTVQFQQYQGGTIAATLIRLKDDGTNIWAKVEKTGSYSVGTNGAPGAVGCYNLRTQPEKFTSTDGLNVRGLSLWAKRSEVAVDATVDGFQATVEDGGTVRLDGEGPMRGWLAGHGNARLGSGAPAKESEVQVALTETAQVIATSTPLYAVTPVGWTETASGTKRTFEKDGAVIELTQVGDDVFAALVAGESPAALVLATPAVCVGDFNVVNSLVGELIVDGAYAKLSTCRALAPNTGTLVVRAGGVCDLPDWNLSGDGNGLGHDRQTQEGQRIVVEEGGRLVLRSKNVSATTPVEVVGGELTLVANDNLSEHRTRVNLLNLGDGAKVTGDGILYMGASSPLAALWSHGSGESAVAVPLTLGGSGGGNVPLHVIADADLFLGGTVSPLEAQQRTAIVKNGPATLMLAANANVPLLVEEGAVRILANQSTTGGLTLEGVGFEVAAGASAAYGALTVSGANVLTLGAGASFAATTLGGWADGATLSVVADDPANIALRLPPLAAEQLAAITSAAKPRWHAVQDVQGNVRFAPNGLVIVVK